MQKNTYKTYTKNNTNKYKQQTKKQIIKKQKNETK